MALLHFKASFKDILQMEKSRKIFSLAEGKADFEDHIKKD